MSSPRLVKLLFVLCGLGLAGYLVHRIGVDRIAEIVERLGIASCALMLLPSLAIYLIDAGAWRATLDVPGAPIGFWRMFAIRTAGEALNMTTPTGSFGGEPVKAYLLAAWRIPLTQGLASVVVAKVAMITAQVCFTLLGFTLGLWFLWDRRSAAVLAAVGLVALGLVAFGVVGFRMVRRYGLFAAVLNIARRFGITPAWLERREGSLRELDRLILGFCRRDRCRCALVVGLFLIGFGLEAVEVYVMLRLLDVPIEPVAALSLCAWSLLIKNAGSFIPWSLGVQDGGNVLLVGLYGWDHPIGAAFALIRRMREVAWITAGFVLLAVLRVPARARDVEAKPSG